MSTRSVVKRNILANVLGGGWVALLGFVAIPVQLRIMGPEAYGVVGLITSIQIVLIILDFGLPTTVLREVAGDISSDRVHSRSVIQICSTVFWSIAILVGVIVFMGADWFSRHWLILEALSPEYVAQCIQIIAVYVMITWPSAIYASAIMGLQRLEIVNALKIITVTCSQLGGIVILITRRDLQSFLLWITAVAAVNEAIQIVICRRLLPGLRLWPWWSWQVAKRIWRFSLDMNLMSTLAVLYTQADRVLISRLLPLKMLGYYNTAYNAARQLATVQEYINSAALPAHAEAHSQGRNDVLRARYFKQLQMIVYLVGVMAFTLIFFGYDILKVWTTVEIAANANTVMGLLALGFLINATISAPYTLGVATGKTRIPLWSNIAILPLYFIVLYTLVIHNGLEGAALTWVLLNIYYVFTQMTLLQWHIFRLNTLQILLRYFFSFVLLGLFIFGFGRVLITEGLFADTAMVWVVCAGCVIGYLAAGYWLLETALRSDIIALPKRYFRVLRRHRE